MAMHKHLGVLLIVSALATFSCAAQSKPDAGPAPCTVAPQPDPCGSTASPSAKPSSLQQFPFPGESSASSSPSSPTPSLTGVPDAPEKPDSPQAPTAKKEFPFPGEASKSDSTSPPDPASSSSSSSSSSDTPQYDPNADPGSSGSTDKGSTPATPGRHILHRINPIGTKLQSADERENEDLSVAHYYIQAGDLQGAYLRGQDAVKTVPDDPGAHFLLAEVALKLNKRDVAIAEYTACLKLDPIENQAKDARKALARLKH
jgi:tetratricopeptide (TPR) repeat protein